MVTLIWPPQPELLDPTCYPPLGLLHIAAYLRMRDIPVQICNLADQQLTPDLADKIPPSVHYGISFTTPMYRSAKYVRDILGSHKVILGGVHPTVMPQETLDDFNADHVVVGDGEVALYRILMGLDDRKIVTGERCDMATLPLPARSVLDYDWIHYGSVHGAAVGHPSTSVISSRGCPWRCNYCCDYEQGQQVRRRTPQQVFIELRHLQKTYGINHVRFVDDVFCINKRWTAEVCNMIAPLGMTWICIARANSMTREILCDMKRAGCVEVCIGVESGSQRMLDAMNKRETVEDMITAVNLIREANIRSKVFLMFGYPGENAESVDDTIRFMETANPDKYTLSTFCPLPGSRIWNEGNYTRDFSKYWFYWDDKGQGNEFLESTNLLQLRLRLKKYLEGRK